MPRLLAVILAAISIGIVTPTAVRAGDIMPAHVASQVGLTQAWRRYVALPAGSQSIVDQQIFVLAENPREYVEIVAPMPAAPNEGGPVAGGADAGDSPEATRVLVRYPTDQIGTDGKPIGKKEAQRVATNEIRRLKRRGIDATLSSSTVPRIHLFTLANDGTLECRDAETGEPVWMRRVGDPGLLYGSIGISEGYVSVINGANLIQVDISDGEVILEVATVGTPLHGAIHAGPYSMVPTIGNGVEGYPLRDPTLEPFMERVAGIALTIPTKSPDSARIAWGTARGFVYVMETEGTPSVLFRLNTDGIVSGRIAAASGDRFFFGSEAGQVYGLRATRTGQVMWSQPFAEPFYNAPMIAGDSVLIRSTYGNLLSLRMEDGQELWETPAPNVDELMGVVGDQIFIRTLGGTLAVLDLNTGRRIASFGDIHPDRLLVNTLTDRLYLVSRGGAVQCLRPVGGAMPTLNRQSEAAAISGQPNAPPTEKPAAPGPFDPDNNVPFKPAAGGDDPFGGDADPFGGGGGEMADPFGADPFGN